MPAETINSERIFEFIRMLFSKASFRTNQYKQVVQKKIDLGALQKKLEQLQFELGKTVDDQYRAGQKDLLASRDIASLLEKIAGLRQAAELLEEEIDQIRNEQQES